MTILEENHHSFLIVEHDPMLYEDAKLMVEYVGQALKQTSREATILLYSPALDPHLQTITELANLGVLHLRRRESSGERAGKDARRPGHFGGVLMRWPWIREARLIEPRPVINPKVVELQTT